jgi:hypothetical protein
MRREGKKMAKRQAKADKSVDVGSKRGIRGRAYTTFVATPAITEGITPGLIVTVPMRDKGVTMVLQRESHED